jgi:hypothetical protein
MVIAEVALQDASEVKLSQDNNVVQTFAADGPDHALGIWILPRRSWSCYYFADFHARQLFAEDLAVDGVAILKKIKRRGGKGLQELFRRPMRQSDARLR